MLSVGNRTYDSQVRVLTQHHCAVALGKLYLHPSASVTEQYNLVPVKGWESDRRSGDALTMSHRLCGLSTYGLKAHVREISTPSKLTIAIEHGQPLSLPLKIRSVVFTALHVMQTRYCDENSVCPSVCPSVCLSHACIVTKL